MRYLINILILVWVSVISGAQTPESDWPVFRGNSDLTGYTGFELPESPVLLWSLSTGVRTRSSPVVSDAFIFFGNEKGTLTASGTDGKVKWKFEAGSTLEAAPLVYTDKVIIGASDGNLRAIDKNSGKITWIYHSDSQIAGSANTWISGKKSGIIFGSYDYFLHCVDPVSGKLLWKLETNNYLNGTPAVANNNIVFGGCDGVLRIADPLTGKEKDTLEIGVYIAGSPALSEQKACLGDYDGNLYCVDLVSRKIAWKIPAGETSGAIMAIPAIGNNAVVIGNENKYLYCYNFTDGKLNWKFRTNGTITGSAVVSPAKVLFGSNDGNIYLVRLKDGKKLWSFNAGSPISCFSCSDKRQILCSY